MSALRDRLTGMLGSSAGRATSWALVGQVAALIASMGNFLLLARILGPSSYGVVAGSLALVLTIGPFASLGADKLVQRDIATKPGVAAAALTSALLTVFLGAAVAAGAIGLLRFVLLPEVPLQLLMALVVAELLASSAIGCCMGAQFAAKAPAVGTVSYVLLSVAKLAAVGAFALTGGTDPIRWAMLYAGSASVAALIGVALSFARFGRPVASGHRPWARAREGLPFSVNVTATVAQNDVDKTLLVRAGFTEEAGLYAAAYRVATIVWIPVLAVLQAMLPRFFSQGHEGGIRATTSLARRLAPPLLAYAAFAAGALLVGARVLPTVLGDEYRGSVGILMLLAPLALFKVAQYVPSEALTGAGRQSTRTACILASTAVNVVLNVMFIPRFGLGAALAATFVAESLYVVLVNLAVRRALRDDRERRPVPVEALS